MPSSMLMDRGARSSPGQPAHARGVSEMLSRPYWGAACAPMQARAIHAAAERLAGEPVPWSSVRNCLVDGSRGAAPRFERVGRGWYQLTAGKAA